MSDKHQLLNPFPQFQCDHFAPPPAQPQHRQMRCDDVIGNQMVKYELIDVFPAQLKAGHRHMVR